MSGFNPRSFAGNKRGDDNQGKPAYKGFDYRKVVLPKIQGPWQITDVIQFEDKTYGKPQDNFQKIGFVVHYVIPGAEKAVTEAEQLAFRQRGHGKRGVVEARPVVSAP